MDEPGAASTELELLRQDLPANRQGRLSPRQLEDWQRGIAYRSKGFFGRIAHSHDAVARDVQAGNVARIDGPVAKKRGVHTEHTASMTVPLKAAMYQVHIEDPRGAVQIFRASAELWNVVPSRGIVRLYYLPESHEAVNVERLADAGTARPSVGSDLALIVGRWTSPMASATLTAATAPWMRKTARLSSSA